MTSQARRRPLLLTGGALCLALILFSCTTQSVIYEKESRFNRIMVTEDNRGLRTLLFDRGQVRQSVAKPGDPDHLELPYAKAAMVALALCEMPRSILIVGLGGGTLPSFLHRHYLQALIDVVEIDPEVVEVARKFFDFREDDRMKVHVDDGRRFIDMVRQPRYDIIFLDAFGAEAAPPHLTTREFLESVRRATRRSGVVVGNLWRRSYNPLYDSMVRTYQEVFDEIFIMVVSGDVNNMLFALPRSERIDQKELAEVARRISETRRFRFDLGALVRTSFVHLQEKKSDSPVLRDADLPRSK